MLYTASFYEPSNWRGECYRVSRGHPRGKRTEWQTQPFLYPARDLLDLYRSSGIGFAELDERYRLQLDRTVQSEPGFREWLDAIPDDGDLTLLCFEPAGAPCHRRSAAAWLLERVPGLELGWLR